MALAYILINSELGKEDELIEKLRALHEVREAYATYGVYDIIAKVEAENQQVLKDAVFTRIRKMDEIRTTLTMIVID
jgi:DNA-binding Lrp family transcriptional regulator